jgi:type IV secretion system protein VirD4
MTAPTPVKPPVRQGAIVFGLVIISFVAVVLYSLISALEPIAIVGKLLMQSNGKAGNTPLSISLACLHDPACAPWYKANFMHVYGWWHFLLLLSPFLFLLMLLQKHTKPVPVDIKAPGSAEWATPIDLPEYLPEANHAENPHVAYLGQMFNLEPSQKTTDQTQPILLPREQWCQNTIVHGGSRSGKTIGFFQTNGALACHLGHTLIVIDTEWRQSNSGMRELLGYWQAHRKNVVLWAPFESGGLRLPLDENITDIEQGMRFADAVMPPPEFQEERGKHFKQVQRLLLAVQARIIARRGGNLENLLEVNMKTLDQQKNWINDIADPDGQGHPEELGQLQSLAFALLSRGDKDFMDSVAAILSALRVFLNANVMRAGTAGTPEETIVLETAFRRPTLVYMAVDPKDMFDGSGTVLIRLFIRRVIQAVFRVAKTTKGGKLPHLCTFLMDELPSYGRINYLMRISSTMRSYRFALVIGIKSNAQGRLVYGRDYWEASSENVVARRIVFPRGLSGEDADDISRRIGLTSVARSSAELSTSSGLGSEDRLTTTTTLHAQLLLPVEEFNQFGVGEAVIISPHHRPIRTVLTPISSPELKNRNIAPGVENWMYSYHQETKRSIPAGASLSEHSDNLVRAGVFNTLTPIQIASNITEVYRPEGVLQPTTPATPLQSLVDGETAANLSVQVPHQQAFEAWVGQVIEQGAEVILSGQLGSVMTMTRKTLPDQGEGLDHYINAGYLARIGQTVIRLTNLGRQALRPERVTALGHWRYGWMVQSYIKINAVRIDGTPERAAVPEAERVPIVGILDMATHTLRIRLRELSQMFPNCEPKLEKYRDSTTLREYWYRVPTRDFAQLSAATKDTLQDAP